MRTRGLITSPVEHDVVDGPAQLPFVQVSLEHERAGQWPEQPLVAGGITAGSVALVQVAAYAYVERAKVRARTAVGKAERSFSAPRAGFFV